jgi:hypothetical protein
VIERIIDNQRKQHHHHEREPRASMVSVRDHRRCLSILSEYTTRTSDGKPKKKHANSGLLSLMVVVVVMMCGNDCVLQHISI